MRAAATSVRASDAGASAVQRSARGRPGVTARRQHHRAAARRQGHRRAYREARRPHHDEAACSSVCSAW